ncbi:MAG: glycosyltransferase family 4 protein [Candidatus Portnoybacteria bacterium]|nr:glycosyltransferase family 4 protein [Candidatus Portnoybacteria bacterium]
MKIAQLVSNLHSASPLANYAIYSHVAWLTNGLVELGHSVDLFAAGDSQTKGELSSVTPESTYTIPDMTEDIKKHYVHLLISKCYNRAKEVDIIHSHFNLLSSFYSNIVCTPTVQSIHSPVNENVRPLLSQFKNNRYISFSLAQRKALPELNWIANIYHGVDTDLFSYNPDPLDYFLFLGRVTEDKGVHLAIEAAKAANVPLIIAGKSYPTEGYWHGKIEEHIDGKMIRYVGEADFEKKIEWLKKAKCLLMPVQWEEPFGMVMIEAMACGTPVVGFKRGSIPEVVADRKTGYVVENVSEMVEAIKNIDKISRQETRKRAEIYFSVEKMVSGYAKVYQRVIEEHKFREDKKNNKS